MSGVIRIDYYTDVLCVWAWIAQRRIDELASEYGDRIEIIPHYINLFGDTEARMDSHWANRGGYDGFGQHVLDAAEPFEAAPVHENIWQQVRPRTSANAHLILKGLEITASVTVANEFARKIRSNFFEHCVDIGQYQVLMGLVEDAGLLTQAFEQSLRDGSAMAALMSNYQLAHHNHIKGSPSWVLDGGRQVLYGNVGYRVLSANVEELLRRPASEASWC